MKDAGKNYIKDAAQVAVIMMTIINIIINVINYYYYYFFITINIIQAKLVASEAATFCAHQAIQVLL